MTREREGWRRKENQLSGVMGGWDLKRREDQQENLKPVLPVVALARRLLETAAATLQLSYFIGNIISRVGC